MRISTSLRGTKQSHKLLMSEIASPAKSGARNDVLRINTFIKMVQSLWWSLIIKMLQIKNTDCRKLVFFYFQKPFKINDFDNDKQNLCRYVP